MTEAAVRDLEDTHDGFTEEDLMVPESRSAETLDEDGNQSDESRMSGVSSISEGDENEADYDTDLDMETESKYRC